MSLVDFCNSKWELPGVVLRLTGAASIAAISYAVRGFKPRYPEWTFAMDILQSVSRSAFSHYGDRFTSAANADASRHRSEMEGRLSWPEATAKFRTKTEVFSHIGLEHIWVKARDHPASAHRFVVLFTHGGGFVVDSPHTRVGQASTLQKRIESRLRDKLGENIQVDILLANYRKAPQSPYPCGPEDAHAMYKYLLDVEKLLPSQIILMGDSAGAGLVMTTLLRQRDEDASRLPLAGVLFYPFVDMTPTNDREFPHCILSDKLVEGFWNAYYPSRGDDTTKWGDASPVHCDLRGLPPVCIQAAGLDVLLPHSKKLFAKAKADGLTSWSMDVIPNVPHGFAAFPESILPITGKALDDASEYVAASFARAA